MTNCCGLVPPWGMTTGCPGLSRSITSFTMDCAVPSCWVFSWKKTWLDSRVSLQEVTTGCNVLYTHRWFSFPLLRRPSHVSSVLNTSFQQIVCGGALARDLCRCPQRVVPFNSLSQLSHHKDFDFHNFSSPGFLTSWMAHSIEPFQQDSSLVAISLWLILHLIFSVLFDIPSEHSAELKWLMLNKHTKWFHSSRVKFPLVKMSSSYCFVSMYLIWIFGSQLIRSNNQSRATLWLLETCLIVGLLPLIIILITASLSSNTYNKASWCEKVDVWGNTINAVQHADHSLRSFAWSMIFVTIDHGLPRSLRYLNWVSKDKNNQIPQIENKNDEEIRSSTESNISTFLIQWIASVWNCEQVHTSVLNLIFQQANVAGVGICQNGDLKSAIVVGLSHNSLKKFLQ